MIGFLPDMHEEELVYSWIARYYCHAGYQSYRYAFEDLFGTKEAHPNEFFLNPLTDEVRQVLGRQIPLDLLIKDHTMFPTMRFMPSERLKKEYDRIIEKGTVRICRSGRANHLKYCPLCVKEDRQQYRETFWRRIPMIEGINVCVKHGCQLRTHKAELTKERRARLYVADVEVSQSETETADQRELLLAGFVKEVFQAPISVENSTISISDYLNERLAGTLYKSTRGDQRNIQILCDDLKAFYRSDRPMTLKRLQGIMYGFCWDFYDICRIAYYLGLDVEEVVNPVYHGKSQVALFDANISRLLNDGMTISAIAEEMHCAPNTVRRILHQKDPKRVYRSPGRKRDWSVVDEKTAPLVKQACQYIRDGGTRPRRVTRKKVEKYLRLPQGRINFLPKTNAVFQQYVESQHEFWGRRIIWAYQQLKISGMKITLSALENVSGMKKNYLMQGIEYLACHSSNAGVECIKQLLSTE